MAENTARNALILSQQIQAKLCGLAPEMQGAILADLVSLWLAGHRPDLRVEIETDWLKVMRDLIAPSEQQVFEHHGGKPEGWK